MKFFTACHTIEDAKKLYRELCIKYHPDISGSDTTSIMQEINAEFDQIFISLKNIHRNKSGETYFKEQTKQTTAPAETAQQFRTIILKLVKMDGVRVELIGSWIWCSGNTR